MVADRWVGPVWITDAWAVRRLFHAWTGPISPRAWLGHAWTWRGFGERAGRSGVVEGLRGHLGGVQAVGVAVRRGRLGPWSRRALSLARRLPVLLDVAWPRPPGSPRRTCSPRCQPGSGYWRRRSRWCRSSAPGGAEHDEPHLRVDGVPVGRVADLLARSCVGPHRRRDVHPAVLALAPFAAAGTAFLPGAALDAGGGRGSTWQLARDAGRGMGPSGHALGGDRGRHRVVR